LEDGTDPVLRRWKRLRLADFLSSSTHSEGFIGCPGLGLRLDKRQFDLPESSRLHLFAERFHQGTEIVRSNADVVLGVFPTAEPQHLGPVQLKEDGTIVRVFDKPADQHFKNTWGIAVWNIRFTEFLHGKVQSHSPEDESPSLGGIFDEAIREGLSVRAVYFEKGSYYDIGRAESLGSLMIQAT
jgi:hypothetical protein